MVGNYIGHKQLEEFVEKSCLQNKVELLKFIWNMVTTFDELKLQHHLKYAFRHGSTSIVSFLLSIPCIRKYMSVEYACMPLITVCCRYANVDTLLILCSSGCYSRAMFAKNSATIYNAVVHGKSSLVLEHFIQLKIFEHFPQSFIEDTIRNGCSEIVQFLYHKQYLQRNMVTLNNAALFQCACEYGHADLALFLWNTFSICRQDLGSNCLLFQHLLFDGNVCVLQCLWDANILTKGDICVSQLSFTYAFFCNRLDLCLFAINKLEYFEQLHFLRSIANTLHGERKEKFINYFFL